MKRHTTLAAALLAALFAQAGFAQTCALDNPAFVPPANDARVAAADIVVMSIGLNKFGAFTVKSAARANGSGGYAGQVDQMSASLKLHLPPQSSRTPMDSALTRDAIILFRLEPGAWEWEETPEKAFFLKPGQRHNPFGKAERVAGNPKLLAVRYFNSGALEGCTFDYNLGAVVKQGDLETPVVIDPRIINGGGS